MQFDLLGHGNAGRLKKQLPAQSHLQFEKGKKGKREEENDNDKQSKMPTVPGA